MGELAVAGGKTVLRTLLGSCLGLVLFDRRAKMGGLAHILLPNSQGKSDLPAKFVDTAIPALIDRMTDRIGRTPNLVAKMSGGANMFASVSPQPIGWQNIEAAERLLREFQVPIVARHLGGEQGRRMRFYAASGRVTIEVVGEDAVEL